jgi:hypothetical protein
MNVFTWNVLFLCVFLSEPGCLGKGIGPFCCTLVRLWLSKRGPHLSSTVVLLCNCPVSSDLVLNRTRVYSTSIHSGRSFFEDRIASRVDGSQWGDESSVLWWFEKSNRMVPLKFTSLETLLRTAIQPYQWSSGRWLYRLNLVLRFRVRTTLDVSCSSTSLWSDIFDS